jgi:DNA-binding transcriptional LysR family regulator
VLRFGALPDSDMVARRIGLLRRMTYASPGYIARLGSPADIDALFGYRMVGLRRLTTGALEPLQFTVADKVCSVMLAAPMSVSGPESYILSARLGLGLVQMPNFHAVDDLARGTLVRVLSEFPPPAVPVSLLYPPNRQLSPRVRIFIDWAAREFEKRNAPA